MYQQPQPGYGAPPMAQPYGAQPGYGGQPVYQQGYGAPPGVMMMSPVVVDPWQALASLPGLVVKENVKLLEFLTGYEQANAYKVYAMNPDGRAGMEVFTLFEKSDCCARQVCGPSRGFDMAVQSYGLNQQFLNFMRPFKCTFLCFARPEIFVTAMDGTSLGSVYSNFRCLDDVLEIRGADGAEIYRVVGACCQPGKFCQCPCPPFDEFIFHIHAPGGAGEPIGNIKRVWPGCGKEMLGDVNSFSTLFPPTASPKDKALILAAVMLVDFLYFEKRNKKDGDALENAIALS